MAYAIDEGPVKIVTREDFIMHENLGWPCEDLFEAIASGDLLCAHNALFEQLFWQHHMVKFYGQSRIPIKRWRCTAAKASARALPRALGDCGRAINAPFQKSMIGKNIMLKMCKPNAEDEWNENPEDFEKLYQYCMDDVEAERAIDKMLPDLNPQEQVIWFLDQLINQRGIYVDQPAIIKALSLIESFSVGLNETVADVSEGLLDRVSRRASVLDWCKEQGVDVPDYTKATVLEVLKRPGIPDKVRQVLEVKMQLGKTSLRKYEAMALSRCDDGRIRDILIYHGAATGRWAGKLIQIQNLPKGSGIDTDETIEDLLRWDAGDFEIFYPDIMGTLSSCIRGMIVAAPGHDLLVADYAAIEARVVMWLANDTHGLNQFIENDKGIGEEPYVLMARSIYGRSNLSKADKGPRALGKTAVLGCGYGMGPDKFLATCTSWGVPATKELAEKAVETYRSTYRRVYNSWFEQENAAITCVQSKRSVNCGKVTWFMEGAVLLCRLPSGRCLVYNNATIEPVETPWGETKDALNFWGLKKVQGGTTTKWGKQHTYGGKIVENITQAVARDILAWAMLRAERAGYSVAFSVHDEIASEVPEDFGSIEEFRNTLCEIPKWALGCPIKAEAWRGKRYKK